MATQWHTAFAFLLRPIMEQYFEVSTNVPVGDIPREADVVLVRRKTRELAPVTGFWRRLTEWNVLEYKGPSVSPRLDDIGRLVELGLRIFRRLNEQGQKKRQTYVPATHVSFWYLAPRLSRRYLLRLGLGQLEETSYPGVLCASVLRHPIFLVSTADLPVETASLPFHLLGVDTIEKKNQVVRLLRDDPKVQEIYNDVWGSLHPEKLQEFIAIARSSKKGVTFHLMPLVEVIGWKEAIHQLGRDQLIDQMATDDDDKKKALHRLLGHLNETEKAELVEQLSKKKRR